MLKFYDVFSFIAIMICKFLFKISNKHQFQKIKKTIFLNIFKECKIFFIQKSNKMNKLILIPLFFVLLKLSGIIFENLKKTTCKVLAKYFEDKV